MAKKLPSNFWDFNNATEPLKRCSDCKRYLPYTEFFKNPRTYFGAQCRRCSNVRAKDYYTRNKEKIIKRISVNRNANIEAARKKEREIYRRRRRKVIAKNRERERGMIALGSDGIYYDSLLRFDLCSYCGSYNEIQVDHIDPVSKNGLNTWDNLTSACRKCNRQKSDKKLLEFLHFSVTGH